MRDTTNTSTCAGLVDGLYDMCGQICLHIVFSFGICVVFLNVLSGIVAAPHSIEKSSSFGEL